MTSQRGWTREFAQQVRTAFYEFLNHVQVKTKEKGWVILGDNLYGAQTTVIDAIFEGLANDIHDFKILKSRQLGVSTIIRALELFWCGVFPVTASLMFDTGQHLQEARQELIDMLERFPASFQFPRLIGNNRYSVTLANKSRINLIAAGVKETKSAGTLGTGSAVSVSHRSELCNYGNVTGLESFRHSLARTNPNRLFVDESTAKGPNIWKEIWDEGKKNPDVICIFCGWWSHPDQKIDRSHPDFAKYSSFSLTKDEKEKIAAVWDQYGHKITPEQLAWIRKEMNPSAEENDDGEVDFNGTPSRVQEQCWTEQEAFQITGSVFFIPEKLTEQMNKNCSRKYKGLYGFSTGSEFTDFRAFVPPNAKSVELRVWEEPVEDSTYVIAADPAFGANEHNDRACVQVLRCYSDGLDQVAEYAWPMIGSREFAWVIAALEAWYSGEHSVVYRIIEMNGPGDATFRELRSLRQQLTSGYFGTTLAERGLANIQRNVRNYIYTRTDSMTTGHTWQWVTQNRLKIAIMERLRDFTHNGMLRIRSLETIEEMRTIAREGDSIEAMGAAKDDRVIALALGVRCWDERVRITLINSKRTRAYEESKRAVSFADQAALYRQAQFDSFLSGQEARRRRMMSAALRRSWKGQ